MRRLITLDELDPRWSTSGRWRLGAAPDEPGGMVLPVATAYVHHTVTADSGDPIADACTVHDTDQARFGKLSYSWLVHRSSRSIIDGETDHRGAHTINNAQQSLNGVSFGIGVIGNYHPPAFPPPATAVDVELLALIADTIRTKLVVPQLVRVGFAILGHRDVFATACCGDLLYARLDDIRALVHPPPAPPSSIEESPMNSVVLPDGTQVVTVIGTDSKVWFSGRPLGGSWSAWAVIPGGVVRNPI